MKRIKKAFTANTMAFLILSMVLAAMSMALPTASANGSITLTPSQSDAGSSVTVTGTGFTPNSALGIGFGQPVQVNGEVINQTGSGSVRTAILANHPIVPGTYVQTLIGTYLGANLNEQQIDDGAGHLYKDTDHSSYGSIDYVAGSYVHQVTVGVTDAVITATYYRYPYDVTPTAGITTSANGSFSANITVPIDSNGTYAVTAIDTSGNRASSNLSVSVVPEGISIGAVVFLSFVVVSVGSYLGKRPKVRNNNPPIS